MAAQILPFLKPGAPSLTPVTCFIRIGETHRKLSELHAAGHLQARHAVVDASRFHHQRELVAALRESGTRIVLDTQAAELAAPAKCGGHARHAPWAPKGGGTLGPANFQDSALDLFVGSVARFAIQNHIDTILAPSHFLGDPGYRDWLTTDRRTCLALRRALDREGGGKIVIDYPVIFSNTTLNDSSARGGVIGALDDMPIENVWIRSSGFGSDAGPLSVKRYIMSISGFHNLGKPIVADYLGGLVAQAALAFGGVSATAHGIVERERFDARDWHKTPQANDEAASFGRVTRHMVPDLYRSLTRPELDVLASAKGGRRICGCGDRTCCLNGYGDMVADHRGHAARQLFLSITAVGKIPDLLREKSFLDGPMAQADRKGREIKGLKPSVAEALRHDVNPEELMKRLTTHSQKLEKLQASLENLHETRGDEGPRARAITPFQVTDARSSQKKP